MSSLTTKRSVIILSLIAGLLALIASGRAWISGSLNDGVIASNAVDVTGNQAVPGYFGIALVAVAGVLAAATAGRIARWPAAVLSLIASLGMVAATVFVLRDPAASVKSRMTAVTGHNGEALARGEFTLWFWVAVFAGLLSTMTSLLALTGLRRWAGLSSRYDAPAEAERKRAHAASEWDLMSAGIDPTADPATAAPPRGSGADSDVDRAPGSHERTTPDRMTPDSTTRAHGHPAREDAPASKEK